MNITSKTKKILSVAVAAATVASALVVYLFIQIQRQGVALDSQLTILAEAEHRQETHSRVKRMVTETEEKRAKIKTAFFTDQSDSLDFITYIEDDLAPRAGVELTTESLAAVPVKDNPAITDMRMQFSYVGTKDAVIDFSRLLEVSPYHSRIEALTISHVEEGKWQARVTLVIVVSTL